MSVEKLLKIWLALEKRFLPSYVWDSDPLTYWRERILFIICFIAAILGPIALVPSLLLAYKEGLWIVILVDSLAYMAAVTILIARNTSFLVRALALCFIFYALGVCILFILGPGGAGYIWLFGASILISTFIGLGAALWTLVFNTITMLSVGFFIAYGNPEWILHVDNALEKWLVMSANFLLLNAFVTITTAFMLNGLKAAFLKEQKISNILRESEERFRAIFERSSIGKSLTAPDGKLLRINMAFADMLGYTIEEVQQLNFAQITHPDDIAESRECIRTLLTGEQADHRMEKRYIHKNGDIVWADVSTTLLLNEQETPLYLITSILDITRRKQAEEELQKLSRKISLILNSAGEGIYGVDMEGTVTFINPAAALMLGYEVEELSGRQSHTTWHHHSPDGTALPVDQCKLNTVLKDGLPTAFEDAIFWKKDGSILPVEYSSTPMFEADKLVGAVVIFKDITNKITEEQHRYKLEAQLLQAQKMEAIGTLAGGIAHDFNNILTAVIGYTEFAQMKLEADSEINEDLKEVLTASVRAKNLIDQILEFSRQSQKERIPVQTGLIIKSALKLIRSSLPVTIDIRQTIQSRSLVLNDPTRLHQIVMNLCTNAAHAMRKNGGILDVLLTDVELDSDFCSSHAEIQPGAYQKLTISDTGHGMTADVINQIFDPFFTTKPKNEGTGLGLSVVHGIVKDSGGTITVYSEPDKGTTFNLYFPIIKGRAEEKPEEHTIIPTGTERILVVDDEKAITDILNKNLSSLGYTVEVRTSSLEALALFKAMPDKFDLVITDMTMTQMTGDKLALELMKIRPDLPVILCTGFSENITKEKAKAMGIKAFLMKPLLKKEMAHPIRKVLDEVKCIDRG